MRTTIAGGFHAPSPLPTIPAKFLAIPRCAHRDGYPVNNPDMIGLTVNPWPRGGTTLVSSAAIAGTAARIASVSLMWVACSR